MKQAIAYATVAMVAAGAGWMMREAPAGAQVAVAPAPQRQAAAVAPIGRFQISAYGYGGGSGRDTVVAGEGVFMVDTATGELWKFSGNTVTFLGTPGAPRLDRRVLGGR